MALGLQEIEPPNKVHVLLHTTSGFMTPLWSSATYLPLTLLRVDQ